MKCIGLFATAVVSLVFTSHAFAEIVTFRSSGLIAQTAEYSFGEDGIGLFGAPGSSLLGANFILETTFDTTNRHIITSDFSESLSDTVPFNVRIMINDRQYSYRVDAPVISLAHVFGGLSELGRGADTLSFQASGRDSASRFVSVSHYVNSYVTPFIGPNATFNTTASFVPAAYDSASSSFSIYGPDGVATRFQTFTLSKIEINPSPARVPEPDTLTLWGAAIFSFAVARKQLKRRANGREKG